jgi:hypothetical protein
MYFARILAPTEQPPATALSGHKSLNTLILSIASSALAQGLLNKG